MTWLISLVAALVGAADGAIFGIRHGRTLAKAESAAQEIAHREAVARTVEQAIASSRSNSAGLSERGEASAPNSDSDRRVRGWHDRLRAADPTRRN
jgi:hypothetical protein